MRRYSNDARKNPAVQPSRYQALRLHHEAAQQVAHHSFSHQLRTHPPEAPAQTHDAGASCARTITEESVSQSRRHELTIFIMFLLDQFNSFLQNKMLPRSAHRPGPAAHRGRLACLRRARLHARGAHSPCTRTSRVRLVTSATHRNHKGASLPLIRLSPASPRLLTSSSPAYLRLLLRLSDRPMNRRACAYRQPCTLARALAM